MMMATSGAVSGDIFLLLRGAPPRADVSHVLAGPHPRSPRSRNRARSSRRRGAHAYKNRTHCTGVESPDEARGVVRGAARRRRVVRRRPDDAAGPVYLLHAAERPERHPPRGSQRSAGHRQRVVPRRLRERAPRPYRIRASVRAPDVHGIGARQAGRVRCVARGSGRQQQRLDDQRSHELLDQRAVERARSGALPRIGPHGLPARFDDAANGRRAARRRQERAPPELREPAVRRGGAAARRTALSEGASLPLAGHRLHGRPDRRQL